MNEQPRHGTAISARLYGMVWAGLIALTGVTVAAALSDLKHLALFTALFVASAKAVLVGLYFMHLRYERPLFRWIVVVGLMTLGIFLGLTFADYRFR